jgi:two-component system, NtrC family, nitrogen regulation sensor histidine kinase NtrY
LKQFFKKTLNRNAYLLLTAIGLFIVAFLLNKYLLGTTSTRYYTRLIQTRIHEKENNFRQLTRDTALLRELAEQDYTEGQLEQLLDRGYYIFIYGDSARDVFPKLLFWNTQEVLPDMPSADTSGGSHIVSKANGEYVRSDMEVQLSNGRQITVVSLIPVLRKYAVQTENLQKEFIPFEKAIGQVDISTVATDFPVRNVNGDVLFYLQKTSLRNQQSSIISIILVLVAFFMLFLFIQQVAIYINEKFGFWYGLAFLVVFILVMRTWSYFFPNVLDLRQFELFDPAIYGSSNVLSSLGDLLINALLFCWVVIFVNRRADIRVVKPYKLPAINWLLVVAVITVQVIFSFTFSDVLQGMVSDAQISFNVTNVYNLTQYSYIGFVILATLALSFFFLSQILLTIAGRLVGARNYIMFIITAAIGLALLSFSRDTNKVELNLYVLLWLLVFMWLMQQKIFSGLNFRLNVSEVLFWLFVFSFSMSAVIIYENQKREIDQRRRYAERIALQSDPASERILSVAFTYLDSNFLSRNFSRFYNQNENAFVKDSIAGRNFMIGYSSRYEMKIYTFDSAGRPLFNSEPASYDTLNTIFRVQGKRTATPGLRYFERSYDRFSYIYRRESMLQDSVRLGTLFVLSDPKNYKADALTPELFRQVRELVPEQSAVYSYAVYDSMSNLVRNFNDYAFPTHIEEDPIPSDQEFHLVRKAGYEELWYRPSADKRVVVARKNNSSIEAITLFAYLFSTFLFLLAFYRFAALVIRSRLRWSLFKQHWQLSIRSQIHSTIIMVSLLSFIVIGIATILFFINRYQRNNQDRLTRAIQIMTSQVQVGLYGKEKPDSVKLAAPVFTAKSDTLIQEISEVHGMDVNLYDTLGDIRITSNPDADIYNGGVLSTKMNPLAYYRLHNKRQVQTVTEEAVGKVNYLSVYAPIRNDHGQAVAYLNIPSYSSQGELKQEISNFLVTVVNLNAFIFLIAGAIALFITNRITNSFTLISQKMRDINLRKMNEKIEWRRDDEIGVLVKEYNKMVQTLDDSAEALAKSEREGAWRQMARQVAHEIKNPLTPMKLSIQYLQKAIDNNSKDVKEMTTNVAKTLIEQIDHLSKIASDFSQFANIGNPKNEVFDLHEMLYSLTSLYEATENLDFDWKPVEQRVLLFADKTQLNRLFTNLLQNAIEASSARDMRVIRMEEELNGEYITVSISDNGTGIPEQTRSMIFTPNFTTKSSGTGLGLAMSKGIVEQAKGELWFVTKEGEGTTFFVKLPLLRATN